MNSDRSDLFRHNGFACFRRLFQPDECVELVEGVKHRFDLVDGERFTRTDALNKLPSLNVLATHKGLRGAVESLIGPDAKFLQIADFAMNANQAAWHRDSPCRKFGRGNDWYEEEAPFQVLKAFMYLENTDSALSIIPRSHNTPFEFPENNEIPKSEYSVLDLDDDVDRPLCEDGLKPYIFESRPGDVLIFDVRMYHRGHSMNRDSSSLEFSNDVIGNKVTLSMCFGSDNIHSERFYSYYRHIRKDLGYLPLSAELRQILEPQNILLRSREANLFDNHPEQAKETRITDAAILEDIRARIAQP